MSTHVLAGPGQERVLEITHVSVNHGQGHMFSQGAAPTRHGTRAAPGRRTPSGRQAWRRSRRRAERPPSGGAGCLATLPRSSRTPARSPARSGRPPACGYHWLARQAPAGNGPRRGCRADPPRGHRSTHVHAAPPNSGERNCDCRHGAGRCEGMEGSARGWGRGAQPGVAHSSPVALNLKRPANLHH